MKSGGFLKQTARLKSSGSLKRSSRRINHHREAAAGIWSEVEADRNYSTHIIKRDGEKCLRCNCISFLSNSHFHGRSHSATRYDDENCDCLCVWCHTILEALKNTGEEYYEWKLKQLGAERFRLLAERANSVFPRTLAIQNCMILLDYRNTGAPLQVNI